MIILALSSFSVNRGSIPMGSKGWYLGNRTDIFLNHFCCTKAMKVRTNI